MESIKPALGPAVVGADNLVEVTIWDLYEPGKPYSFPVRVTARHTIDVPMLGEVPVEGRTIPQVESILIEGFRKGEYLLNPRVLVRSLDAPIIKVRVTGAVNRAGFVELTRSDCSVYAAILSAGGLKKTSGSQVAVTRRIEQPAVVEITPALPPTVGNATAGPAASVTENVIQPVSQHGPEQRANSVEDISVPATPPLVRPAGAGQPLFCINSPADPAANPVGESAVVPAIAAPPASAAAASRGRRPEHDDSKPSNSKPVANVAAENGDQEIVWYNLALAHDCDQLKSVVLAEGDIVTVKEAAPPLRIGGAVNRPGAYPLPPGRTLNAWQAIELAGGVRDETIPLNITLLRPAGDGRGARRWYLSVADYQQHPPSSPFVQPGDMLQVEPTTGSKIKRAVGDLWSKP